MQYNKCAARDMLFGVTGCDTPLGQSTESGGNSSRQMEKRDLLRIDACCKVFWRIINCTYRGTRRIRI